MHMKNQIIKHTPEIFCHSLLDLSPFAVNLTCKPLLNMRRNAFPSIAGPTLSAIRVLCGEGKLGYAFGSDSVPFRCV